MDTMVIITNMRELMVLHRWLLVKVAKDPKTVILLLRLMLFGRVKNRRMRRNVKVKIEEKATDV
jgi:ribosomal protein S17